MLLPFSLTSWVVTKYHWQPLKYINYATIQVFHWWIALINTYLLCRFHQHFLLHSQILLWSHLSREFLLAATNEPGSHPVMSLLSPTCSQLSQCEWLLWATSCSSNPTPWRCGRRSLKPRCHPPWTLPKSPCYKRWTRTQREASCYTENVIPSLVCSERNQKWIIFSREEPIWKYSKERKFQKWIFIYSQPCYTVISHSPKCILRCVSNVDTPWTKNILVSGTASESSHCVALYLKCDFKQGNTFPPEKRNVSRITLRNALHFCLIGEAVGTTRRGK